MERQIEKLYAQVPRFEEGAMVLDGMYRAVNDERLRLFDLLVDAVGPALLAPLNDYTDALSMETEFEARHYFREGYLAAKREATAPPITPTP